MKSAMRDRIAANLQSVQDRMAAACLQVGRPVDAVRLVAVTKNQPVEACRALIDLGQLDLAENRPQALWERAAALPTEVRWHLIGHLQSNKIKRTVPLLTLLHSVDRVQLAASLAQQVGARTPTLPILLEVNIADEAAKHGFSFMELPAALTRISNFPGLEVRGLMGMARQEVDPERCRPSFDRLRHWRDEHLPGGELSMGMSGDFEVAIAAGATLVRIGSALFEGLG